MKFNFKDPALLAMTIGELKKFSEGLTNGNN